MNNMTGIIYEVISQKTSKIYIGQTAFSLYRRKQTH